jgi:hypothetical protein
MSDIGPYGVTQHADAAAVTANQLVGEHAGSVTANAVVDGAGPAFLSTAPYRKRMDTPGPRGCWGGDGRCRAYPMKGERYCIFHLPQDPK